MPQVDEIDPPSGTGLVRVSASALNPVDISIGSGRFYGGSPPTPYTVGSEATGTTEDGRRVWVRGGNRGSMAEVIHPEGGWVFDVPEGIDDALALACGIAGLTAWLAVSWRAPVREDDTVLVLGASGALGSVAVQGAKALGARRVIGAARRTELIPAEADEVVDLAAGELPEATYIVDALWGEPFERALAAAASGVRVVHLGQSAGPAATLQSAWVRGKVADIFGHSLFSLPAAAAETGYRELCEHARDGRITFAIERYPLAEVDAAWERQASGSPGAKIVLEF
jgi:NADPH:quinone reductase-like Zn-dependent oxidoreductase